MKEKSTTILDTHHLLAASLYESGTGIIILGRDTKEGEIKVLHTNSAAVQIMQCAAGTDIPELHTLANIEKVLDLPGKLKKALFTDQKPQKWLPLGTFSVGEKVLSITGGIISSRKHERACTIYLHDVTEWKLRETEREEFFSITSHELRTPLIAIQGSAKFIVDAYKGQYPDETVEVLLGEIATSSERLITMVNDFLNMAKLEQGKFSYQFSSFDPKQIANEVVRELQATAKERGLELKLVTESDFSGFADAGRVKQILTNLVGNALKFTREGSVTVSLSEENESVVVRVTDTGEGIPEGKQNKLFQKFSQIKGGKDALTLDGNRSSGLGLYISKMMADDMSCSVGLEKTEPGVGSVFILKIPKEKID